MSDDLLPGERARLNRRYAEALQADPALVPADERVMRLASYWYHAHDPAKALPAVLDASVEARCRRAYSEQLRLLERAMELWETVPEDIRAALRPVDHTEAYPPCGCDPATTPLRYLDLMAEAAVAGRYCGERERALKITRRALRLLEDEDDPLRSAWFWVQRSRLTHSLGRGGGREELARAEELLRGLPPNEVHAELLTHIACWSLVHVPGPEAYGAAERAVEYARLVGARETELDARQVLGVLMVDAGHIEAGLAELHEVREQALAEDTPSVALNAYVNLPSELEGIGHSREAVPILEEGLAFAKRHGPPDAEAWVWGNLAESLLSLGRWDEADRACAAAGRVGRGVAVRGFHAGLLAELALARGDLAEADRQLVAAQGFFGSHEHAPQNHLPSPASPSESPRPRAAPWTPAPTSPAPTTATSGPAPSATPGPCCSPRPPPRATPVRPPPPTPAAPTSSTASGRPPGGSPPSPPSGRPTNAGSARSSCAPRVGPTRRTGPRWSPPSSAWNGPTTSPAPGTAWPRPFSPSAATTSATGPRSCCASCTRSPRTSAPALSPKP